MEVGKQPDMSQAVPRTINKTIFFIGLYGFTALGFWITRLRLCVFRVAALIDKLSPAIDLVNRLTPRADLTPRTNRIAKFCGGRLAGYIRPIRSGARPPARRH